MDYPTQPLNAAQQFFFDHADYSFDPATETAQAGRTRCAIYLETAERILLARKEAESIQFVWEHDDIDSSDFEAETRPLWVCRLQVEGCTAASMGGIDGAPGDTYSRVVEAELAAEWLEADTKAQLDAFRK